MKNKTEKPAWLLQNAIVILIGVGLLAVAVFFIPAEKEPLIVDEEEEETVYFAVFIEGKKSGYGEHARLVKEGQVRTRDGYNLSMNRGDVTLSVSLWETSIETEDGKPVGFETSQNLGAMQLTSRGTYQSEGFFDVQIQTAGIQQQRKVELPTGALMPEGLNLLSATLGFEEGKKIETKIFVPSLLAVVDAEVTVGPREQVDLLGRVVELTRVDTLMKLPSGAIPAVAYVDEEQMPQKMVVSVMDLHMELIACERSFALSDNDPPELIAKTVLKSPRELGDIKSHAALRYRLRSKNDQALSLISDQSQQLTRLNDKDYQLNVSPKRAIEGETLPYRGQNDEALAALKPGQYIQSDHAEIVALAQKAIGDAKDAAQAAQRIETFVRDHINEKSLSVGWASAVEVARSREGDCSEHAVLTAALCRAAGIPARMAVGYVFVPEFVGHKNIFGGHAWTQAYINEQWIGLDATRAPNGYSAAHITCAVGDGSPESFLNMALLGGQFEIIAIENVDQVAK